MPNEMKWYFTKEKEAMFHLLVTLFCTTNIFYAQYLVCFSC